MQYTKVVEGKRVVVELDEKSLNQTTCWAFLQGVLHECGFYLKMCSLSLDESSRELSFNHPSYPTLYGFSHNEPSFYVVFTWEGVDKRLTVPPIIPTETKAQFYKRLGVELLLFLRESWDLFSTKG
jgi:hypothetical protein